jgi:polyisoprenoid-binding protein YceI
MATLTKWVLDPMHSEVQFKVKHLVISTVTGFFKSFEGSLETENEDFTGANITFSLDVNSIDTNQDQRDGHLKSADFLTRRNIQRSVSNQLPLQKTAMIINWLAT